MRQQKLEQPRPTEAGENRGLPGLVGVGAGKLHGEIVDLSVAAPVVLYHGPQPANHIVGDPRLVGIVAQRDPDRMCLSMELYGARIVAACEVVASLQVDTARQAIGVVGVERADSLDQLGHALKLRPGSEGGEAHALVSQHVAVGMRGEARAQVSLGLCDDLGRPARRAAVTVGQADHPVEEVPRFGLARELTSELSRHFQAGLQPWAVELLFTRQNAPCELRLLRHVAVALLSLWV